MLAIVTDGMGRIASRSSEGEKRQLEVERNDDVIKRLSVPHPVTQHNGTGILPRMSEPGKSPIQRRQKRKRNSTAAERSDEVKAGMTSPEATPGD
jgi:hypothetical protein